MDNKKFLKERGIKRIEIFEVNRLGNIEGGIGQVTGGYVPNPSAENYLPNIARNWLEKEC